MSLSSVFRAYAAGYLGLTATCWKGIVVSMISSMFAGAFYFLTIYFVNNLKLDIESAGFIISFYGLGAILGGYLGGKLSDQFAPLPVSIVNLLIRSLVFLTLIKMSDPQSLAIALFILGIASFGFITSIQVFILGECQHDEHARLNAINIMSLASNLGLGISAIMIAVFTRYGFHFIFLFCSSILFILAIYLITLHNDNEKSVLSKIKDKIVFHQKDDLMSKKLIWLLLICLLLSGSIVAQYTTTYSIYIQNKFSTLGIQGFSALFTINTFLVLTLQVPIVNYFSKFDKLKIVGIGAFAIGLGMFLVSLTNIYSVIIIACLIYTIGEMLFFSMTNLICYQNGSQKRKGHQLGLYRMTYASSRIIGPIAGGVIYHHFGGDTLWMLCGFVGLACLLACGGYNTLSNTH